MPIKSSDSLFDVEVPSRFHNAIATGSCVAIVKRGRRNIKLGPATMGSSISGCGVNVDITALRICTVARLHMGDARAAGFSSTRHLKIFLKSVYKDLQPSDEMTQINFIYLGSVVGRKV